MYYRSTIALMSNSTHISSFTATEPPVFRGDMDFKEWRKDLLDFLAISKLDSDHIGILVKSRIEKSILDDILAFDHTKVREVVKNEDGTQKVELESLDPDYKMPTNGLQYLYNQLHQKFILSTNLDFSFSLKEISNFHQLSNESLLKSFDRFLKMVNDFRKLGGELNDSVLTQYFLTGCRMDQNGRMMLSTHLKQMFNVDDSKSVTLEQLRTVLQMMFRFEYESANTQPQSEAFWVKGKGKGFSRSYSPRASNRYTPNRWHNSGRRSYTPNRFRSQSWNRNRSFSPSYRHRQYSGPGRNHFSLSYSPTTHTSETSFSRGPKGFSRGGSKGFGKGKSNRSPKGSGRGYGFRHGKGKGKGKRTSDTRRFPSPVQFNQESGMNC